MNFNLRPPLLSLVCLALAGVFTPQALAQDYEAYYLNRNTYPRDAGTDWSESLQGIAHDDNNWFITRSGEILKIPVGADLRTVSRSSPGFLSVVPTIPGYSHLGDPDVYRHNNADYLVVPIEGGNASAPGAIAVFRCSDLSMVLFRVLTHQDHDAGWCCIDKRDGALYSSLQHASELQVYDLNWGCLDAPCDAFVTYRETIPLRDEQGIFLLDLVTTQGGEFAPGGKLLYLVSGFLSDSDEVRRREGITVIDTTTWRRAAHSTLSSAGPFYYYWDPGAPTYGEPEGLTIWDLDDGRAPGIRGQLHAIVVDNDGLSTDEFDLYNYTNLIRVNPANTGAQTGTPEFPFRTLTSAADFAWNDSEIRLRAAVYPERPTISKRVRLTAESGVVRIGN